MQECACAYVTIQARHENEPLKTDKGKQRVGEALVGKGMGWGKLTEGERVEATSVIPRWIEDARFGVDVRLRNRSWEERVTAAIGEGREARRLPRMAHAVPRSLARSRARARVLYKTTHLNTLNSTLRTRFNSSARIHTELIILSRGFHCGGAAILAIRYITRTNNKVEIGYVTGVWRQSTRRFYHRWTVAASNLSLRERGDRVLTLSAMFDQMREFERALLPKS